ncbi:glycosyl transferase family 1 [Streptomyces fodineus]|uniref:Glycosyl transferase family 1 n=1 Tax=Streptomyces fodineus TaxID=1904616 RepID=A0A1D7YP27_9ACTN|nr:glycosyl transferase family 1 [Streptomyces fodineus]
MSVEVCTDDHAFAELAEDWGRLHRACRPATPFQSHAWLHSWWLSYGTPGGLRLVLVREHGELVAVAPLMRLNRPWPALVPLGGAITDFSDVLLDGTAADRVALALADALAELARTALIDFREVRPGGAVERIYGCWRGPRHRVPDSTCLELPALPMDQLIRRLPSARAQRIRNKVNKLDRVGVGWRVVRYDETEGALRRLLELHRLQWEGRKVSPEHLRPRFLEHLIRSAEPMARSGEAVVREFLLDGEVVGAELTLMSRRWAGVYLYGVHPRLRELRTDVATMVLRAATEHVAAGGACEVLSLLRGTEPYKYRWDPQTVVNQRLLLARKRTAPLLAAAAGDATARGWGRTVLRRPASAGGPPAV